MKKLNTIEIIPPRRPCFQTIVVLTDIRSPIIEPNNIHGIQSKYKVVLG
jgi:hypothetical protein